jgi:maltooligosyltrehalose trehalohydrolase
LRRTPFGTNYFKKEDNVSEEVICGTTEVARIAEVVRDQRTRPQQSDKHYTRHFPIGAEVVPGGGVHFRVWAPRTRNLVVELGEATDASPGSKSEAGGDSVHSSLLPEGNGYFSGFVAAAHPGMLYRLRLDSGSFPDPASRFQPDGPHGPSQIVAPAQFQWTDQSWSGIARDGQAIYELHIGTFTREGMWRTASNELAALRDLGVTIIEVMPVADFSGRFGWGYDGVNMFAPTRLYGSPDDMRAFINRAHELGLGVILDVVYNHFGPDGNYVGEFSRDYFSARYKCEWGEALNFDGENSAPVREFFLTNAAYWVSEFHLDGLRIDATQQIYDESPIHILTEIGQAVRKAAGGRETFIVNENECQHTRLLRDPGEGGCGLDASWNDDFHHSARVAMTGKAEAYYSEYRGTPQELISAVKWGYLFQGQRYEWQRKRRGTPALDLPPGSFVNFIQNHDQVANSLRGERIHQLTSPGRLRAMTALLLLAPQTPMLFMGQEFAASAPFLYFADHKPELAKLVRQGRLEFLSQFKTIASPGYQAMYRDPESEATFRMCALDFSEREKHAQIYALHRELLHLRRADPVFSQPKRRGLDGAVLAAEAFVLRFFGEGWRDGLHHSSSACGSACDEEQTRDSQRSILQQRGDRLLVVNLGTEVHLCPASEPLLAPPGHCCWKAIFSTDQACFGGGGAPEIEDAAGRWWLPGHAATVMVPERVID